MTLDQLEMVEAIISEGSYQAAAKKLNKSQPSISVGIKKIEDFYGIEIFSRQGYRPTLTDLGKRFYESARFTLESYRKLDKLAKELGSGVELNIKIALDDIVLSNKIDPLFKVLAENKYLTTLKIVSGILDDNILKLQSGDVDFAIGMRYNEEIDFIESKKICDIELYPVVHKSIVKDEITLDFLNSTPNIVVNAKNNKNSKYTNESGLRWYVDRHSRKTELIELGVGWGRLSTFQISNIKDLIVIPTNLISKGSYEVFIMRNNLRPSGPIAQEIWNAFN